MGQSSSQHQAELPNATKRWRHWTQVIVIVLFLTYLLQPAASSTHPHSAEKINKTCLLNTSEIALFMARGRRREVGGGVEVKQEVRTAEAVTGVN